MKNSQTPTGAKTRGFVALLTPDEVAEKLRVDTRTLANWRYRGCGPVFLRFGGLVRYSTADLEQFIEASRHYMTRHPVNQIKERRR